MPVNTYKVSYIIINLTYALTYSFRKIYNWYSLVSDCFCYPFYIRQYFADKQFIWYDPRDKARILVYVDPSIRVGEGSIGYVARDDKQIATLVFHLDGSALSASAQSVAAGQALRPFDTVSVDAANVAPTPTPTSTSTSAPVSGSK